MMTKSKLGIKLSIVKEVEAGSFFLTPENYNSSVVEIIAFEEDCKAMGIATDSTRFLAPGWDYNISDEYFWEVAEECKEQGLVTGYNLVPKNRNKGIVSDFVKAEVTTKGQEFLKAHLMDLKTYEIDNEKFSLVSWLSNF